MNSKAIDDIYMHDMECEHPIDCDFEDSKFDYCSWQNAESSVDDFDWELFSSYSDGRFGIVPDHTLDDEDGHLALGKIITISFYLVASSNILISQRCGLKQIHSIVFRVSSAQSGSRCVSLILLLFWRHVGL